ncbi:hypothetical protein VTK26DRAFT_7816 [Humicola hyalothermophila]
MAPPSFGVGIRQRTKLAHDAPLKAVVRNPVRPAGKSPKPPARSGRQPENAFGGTDDDHATHVESAEGISVALEWKLLIPLLSINSDDPQPYDERDIVRAVCDKDEEACLIQAHELVAREIREFGEKAVTAHSISKNGLQETDFWDSTWIVKKANSAVPLDREKFLDGYIWVPVEICSPKMPVKKPDTRVRMQGVLNALTSAHRLVANCSCEVHIHLGRVDGRSWSLSTLKRLGSLLWAAEPTLRSIRDPSSANFHNIYTWGFAMRQHSRLAKLMRGVGSEMPGLTLAEPIMKIPDEQVINGLRDLSHLPVKEIMAISEIWQAPSHLELGRLLSGSEKMYRRLGFNFSAFGEEDERARRSPRTVEFRFMEGSVDPDLILNWLGICGTIVETAVARSDDRFASALSRALQLLTEDHLQHMARPGDRPGERRARQFRELMQAFGVPEMEYRGFAEKIEREHQDAGGRERT